MGSLAAILLRSGTPKVKLTEPMLAAAPHRGRPLDSTVQGSCVLAIAGSEERPNTSLATAAGIVCAFAGVLDNQGELMKELGYPEGPVSTAQFLIDAFRRYGDEVPTRLRGIFAVLLWDGSRLVCFRDQVGFATLYYRDDPSGFYVATEAKQVVAGAGIRKEPDLAALEAIFYKNYEDETTALSGVRRLPRATLLVATEGRVRTRRYWSPQPTETARLSPGELQERFDLLMSQATARVLTGEDGVSLSGGIDSPAVAAFAAPHHLKVVGRPLPAVCVIFPQFPAVDERRYVDLVATQLGLPLHTYEQTGQPLDRLSEWSRLADGPIPDASLPLYEEHYRRVRALGVRNLLTGELAEFVCDMRDHLIPHLLWHGRLIGLGSHLAARRRNGASTRMLARHVISALVPTQITASRLRRTEVGVADWLDPRKVNEAAARSLVPLRERWRKVQLGGLRGPGISVEADDICQEITGVRCRRPWVDVDLWEFFLALPAEVKFPGAQSKGLVRRLLRDRVPDVILDRTDKTVFDDSIMSRIDYPSLRRWLLEPKDRIPGVRYELLQGRLESETLTLLDFMWAKDLASVHAFLSLW